MIRNAVFDMGNVLIRFDPQWFIEREGVRDPADRLLILRELFQSTEWAMMDLGFLTEETAEPLILSRFPERLKKTVSHLLYHWPDERTEIPGMCELVRELRQNGYRLYLLSNASVAHHQYWPKYPVSEFFDGVLVSADLRKIKPMNEIYAECLKRFSLLAEECVFIDDLPANVAGAVANGWQGIVFHGDVEELREKLKKIGVDPGKRA